MGYNVTITKSATSSVEVPEDVADVLEETYQVLKTLTSTNQANLDFYDRNSLALASDAEIEDAAKAARLFVRQAKQWASAHPDGLEFARRGSVSDDPTRVSFRVYHPLTDAEKAANKAAAEMKAKDKAAKAKAAGRK